jgi:hypothetical protein
MEAHTEAAFRGSAIIPNRVWKNAYKKNYQYSVGQFAGFFKRGTVLIQCSTGQFMQSL